MAMAIIEHSQQWWRDSTLGPSAWLGGGSGSATAFGVIDLRGLADAPGADPTIGAEREVDDRPAFLRRPHAQVLRFLVVRHAARSAPAAARGAALRTS